MPTANVRLPCKKEPPTNTPKEKQAPTWPSISSPTNHGPEREETKHTAPSDSSI